MCRVMEEMRGDEQIECALADGVLCYLDFREIILCEESDECITLLADRHSFM